MISDNDLAIIKKYQKSAPVDILSIAKELGIKVYQSAGKTLSGKIVKDPQLGGESGFAIYVNSAHSKVRQRFTVAHEIAHFILHRAEIGDGIVDDALYRSGLSNKIELEANKLAAEILMPWDLINNVMDEKITSIKDLSDIFQVSESAMSIRMGVPT